MNDEQINAAIAEACGRKRRPDGDWYPDNGSAGTQAIPNYCTDLNAMHEAEKVLTKEQRREYQNYMYDMACEIDNTYGRWMPYSATARYRAEAFLKTMGKWEEVQK
jgi:hypothetical protein